MTWGDDDAQYTSYGDGFGFEPRVEKKLGMGFARITGGPGDYRGVNLRSDGERTGDGAKSPKASGMLMVDGVLYLWVRNVGNAQLLWSRDRGKTWQWGFKMETGFGSPAFLNFGRNYAGARDGFVYTYSQDGPSAYESDNGVVLARVPKDRIRERGAWEFFERLDAGGRPVWTADVTRRGAVFALSGELPAGRRGVRRRHRPVSDGTGVRSCRRMGTLRRAGAVGSVDDGAAPAVGRGGTHGYRLPAKWISADGLTHDAGVFRRQAERRVLHENADTREVSAPRKV